MNCATGIATVGGAAIPNSARTLARVEKPSGGSGLHNEFTAEERAREFAARRSAQHSLSHSETHGTRNWRGPHLSSPFVAQLLGQVLAGDGADSLSAHAAYRKAHRAVATGMLLDGKV